MKKISYIMLLIGCFTLLGCASFQSDDTDSMAVLPADGTEVVVDQIDIDFSRANPCDGIKVCKVIICHKQPTSEECNLISESERKATRIVVYESKGCTYTQTLNAQGIGVGHGSCPP
ncbi:hypothetical protein BEN71_15225 [Acinetobacter wuhouensis]|nr:hypothetical protein BEN71_15225 [Acinetobacter wuhouensis]